jgi:hypothetical protein
MHKLKWSLQKDRLARMVRDHTCVGSTTTMLTTTNESGEKSSSRVVVHFGRWLETKGRGIVEDGERVRLALCPDIRKIVRFYESIALGNLD